ncbi:MAG: Gx transporter family protein [Candidatus Syntrophosphaera sp.]|nr:Gx transporter family protein [Candidatus Cloacimonadota bacterium]MDY0112463.1 Gx transporter family protein [Candidatus Syntrophosphaera sp.]
MKKNLTLSSPVNLAFLTATACTIHIFESLIMRLLPLPFLRLGLSNIIVMYLILQGRPLQAVLVNVTKSIVSGAVTFTLMTPATLLSLGGGLFAILAMWLACISNLGFTEIGVSICGAIAHNIMQLILVQTIVLPGTRVFVLTPLLLFLGLITGIITAWLLIIAEARFNIIKTDSNE